MANNELDFKDCPVGIKNAIDIEHLSKTFDLRLNNFMDRIEEKIDNMNDKMHSEFLHLNGRLDSLDDKVNKLDKKLENVDNLENFVEEKIADNTKDKVFRLVKWVVTVLIGGAAVTVLGNYAIRLFAKS